MPPRKRAVDEAAAQDEVDALRAQVQRERERFAAMEAVRLAERQELVRSYEAMLSEQARARCPPY